MSGPCGLEGCDCGQAIERLDRALKKARTDLARVDRELEDALEAAPEIPPSQERRW